MTITRRAALTGLLGGAALGFTADTDFEDVIRAHIRDTDAAAGGPQG